MVGRLTAKFNSYYAARPVLTMMITNAVLGGIADTVAQSITAIRQAAVRKQGGVRKDDSLAIEIHELDRKNPLNDRDLIPDSKILPPPFDFERLTRFMAYGFAMAPVQFKWFQFLSRAFPITKSSAFGPALKMVAMDQLVFAPVGMILPCLLTGSTWLTILRYCQFLHSHDHRRGRRKESSCSKAAGYVPTNAQGQLYGLAFGTNHQFPSHANSIPTSKLFPMKLFHKVLDDC